jgi:ketosteroid isomerase-like protein
MLGRIRAGFTLVGEFGGDLDTDAVVEGFARVVGPHATEDFTCVMDGGMMTTSYQGVEGLKQGWADFLGGFETLAISPVAAREGAKGACVVEFVHLRGRPKGIDASIEEDAAAVWRLRDGRLSAVEFYMSRDKALHAGGIADT